MEFIAFKLGCCCIWCNDAPEKLALPTVGFAPIIPTFMELISPVPLSLCPIAFMPTVIIFFMPVFIFIPTSIPGRKTPTPDTPPKPELFTARAGGIAMAPWALSAFIPEPGMGPFL